MSRDDGWVLGSAPCAQPPCTSLVRTRDGGRSWHGLPAPRAALDEGGDRRRAVSSVHFVNGRDGFAFSPGLWSTHDGAENWHPVRSVTDEGPYAVLEVEATSEGSVYALVAPADPSGGPSTDLRLLRAAPATDRFMLLANLPSGATASKRLVVGGATAYVSIGRRLLSFGRNGRRVTRLPSAPCDIAASSADDLLAICGQGVASGSMGDRKAYGTTDAGTRWLRLPDPGRGAGYGTQGVAATRDRHAVIGTLSAAGSGLLATFDGAEHWRTVLRFRGQVGGFADLGFQDDQYGTVIHSPATNGSPNHDGVLLRTTDGGRTWSPRPYR